MKCPSCSAEMEPGFMYVRGFGSSLHWSKRGDAGFLSRQDLELIDLNRISVTGIGAQAVVPAARCPSCTTLAFKTS